MYGAVGHNGPDPCFYIVIRYILQLLELGAMYTRNAAHARRRTQGREISFGRNLSGKCAPFRAHHDDDHGGIARRFAAGAPAPSCVAHSGSLLLAVSLSAKRSLCSPRRSSTYRWITCGCSWGAGTARLRIRHPPLLAQVSPTDVSMECTAGLDRFVPKNVFLPQ